MPVSVNILLLRILLVSPNMKPFTIADCSSFNALLIPDLMFSCNSFAVVNIENFFDSESEKE